MSYLRKAWHMFANCRYTVTLLQTAELQQSYVNHITHVCFEYLHAVATPCLYHKNKTKAQKSPAHVGGVDDHEPSAKQLSSAAPLNAYPVKQE